MAYDLRDFVNKRFVVKIATPAYFSTLAKRVVYNAVPGEDEGRIQAIVVNKKTGNKFFAVRNPNYPSPVYFNFSDADFSKLVGQGVRTVEEKAKDEKQAREADAETIGDKIKKGLLIVVGLGGLAYVAGVFVKAKVNKK